MTKTNKTTGGIADKIISRLPIPKHRTRTLRPEILFDEELFGAEKELGLPVRMVFLALHTIADRKGLFSWDQSFTKFLMLDDQEHVKSCLDILHERGFLVRYRSSGASYGMIPSFADSQYLNPRETESSLPKPNASGTEIIGIDGDILEVVVSKGAKAKRTILTSETNEQAHVQSQADSHNDEAVEANEDFEVASFNAPVAIETAVLEPEQTMLIGIEVINNTSVQSEILEGELVSDDSERGELISAPVIRFTRIKLGGSTATVRIDPDSLIPVLPLNDKDHSPRLEIAGLVPVIGGEGVWLTEARLAHFESIYPDGDNLTRIRVAIDWLMNNPAKRKTIQGLPRYFGSFLSGAQNSNQHIKRHGMNGLHSNDFAMSAHKADIKSAATAKAVGGLFSKQAREQSERSGGMQQ